MNTTSRIWGTQEQAIAAIRGTNGRVYRHKHQPIVAVIRERDGGRASFAVWHGKAAKPAAYFSASTVAAAERSAEYYVRRYAANYAARAERRAEQAAKRAALKASDHFTAGDVLVNSWGYEQTNVDFYQVTQVGAKTIVVRRIGKKAAERGFLQGVCQPDRFNFTGAEERKTVSPWGGVSFRHGGCTKWDGRPVHWTAYH